METKRTQRGFRLIDLISVIIILIVLACIFLHALKLIDRKRYPLQCSFSLKQISLAMIMYAHDNDGTFPTGGPSVMADLSLLYPDYISKKKVFCCDSDAFVTVFSNATIVQGIPFTAAQCSYGYDNTHSLEDGPDVAIVADRPSNTADNTPQNANSPNHGGSINAAGIADVPGQGQNVLFIDGHVEWAYTPLAGWYGSGGNRDNIYVNDSKEGTDTYITHDGK